MEEPVPVASIHFDEIEAYKENFKPLKSGRRVVDLAAYAAAQKHEQPKELSAELKAARTRFEDRIRSYEGTDPLAPWLDYIVWTQGAFPGDSKKAMLLPLLNECVQRFVHDERYKNNAKYVRVWLMYADLLPDPEKDVFLFLHTNRIGYRVSQFWEAWALVLERRGRVEEALRRITEGIASEAQPSARLAEAEKRLQARVMKRLAKQLEQGSAEGPAPLDAPSEPPRRALQTLQTRRGLAPSTRGTAGTPAPAPAASAHPPAFQVYRDPHTDDSASGGGCSVLPAASSGPSEWTNFGRLQDRDKENTGTPTPWTAAAHSRTHARASAATAPPPPPPMDIFIDEECKPTLKATAPQAGSIPSSLPPAPSIRQQVDSTRAAAPAPAAPRACTAAPAASSGARAGATAGQAGATARPSLPAAFRQPSRGSAGTGPRAGSAAAALFGAVGKRPAATQQGAKRL